MVDPLADVDGFLASMEQYAALGIEMVEVMPLVEDPVAWVTRLGERSCPDWPRSGPDPTTARRVCRRARLRRPGR